MTGAATTTVSDSLHSTFTQAAVVVDGGTVAVYYATLSASGTVVTAGFSSGVYNMVFVYEVLGVTTAGAAVATGSGNGCMGITRSDIPPTSSSLSFQGGSFLFEAIFDGNAYDGGAVLTRGPGPTIADAAHSTYRFAAYSPPSSGSGDEDFTANIAVNDGESGSLAIIGLALDPTASVLEFPTALSFPVLFIIATAVYLSARRGASAGA